MSVAPAFRLGVMVVAAWLASSCAPSGAAGVLDKTASNLGDITSGQLHLRFAASAGAEGPEKPVGFALDGPFALPQRKGALPVARLELSRLRGAGIEKATVFVATGDRAFVEVGSAAYELAPEQVEGLRGGEPGTGGLDALDVAGWAEDPELADGGSLDGVAVERVTADLDALEALNDLVEVAARLGAGSEVGLKRIDGKAEEQFRRAVRSARMEVLTGKKDRLLRKLRLNITLAGSDRRLVEALGPLAGARLVVELDIARPNEPVRVDPPARSRPVSELPDRR